MKDKKKIFVICPVRGASKKVKKFANRYVARLEYGGYGDRVYYPPRDTDQSDQIGIRICESNRRAIVENNEIHVIWKSNKYNLWQKMLAFLIKILEKLGNLQKSEGSYFDLGMAFMAQHFMPSKKIILANPIDFKIFKTLHKSFENVLLVLHEHSIKKSSF